VANSVRMQVARLICDLIEIDSCGFHYNAGT